jgi:hypothetical protein
MQTPVTSRSRGLCHQTAQPAQKATELGQGAHALPCSPMIAPDEFRQFQPRSRAKADAIESSLSIRAAGFRGCAVAHDSFVRPFAAARLDGAAQGTSRNKWLELRSFVTEEHRELRLAQESNGGIPTLGRMRVRSSNRGGTMRLNHLRRREFITALGAEAAAWPLAAGAQQPERMRRVGVLHCAPADQLKPPCGRADSATTLSRVELCGTMAGPSRRAAARSRRRRQLTAHYLLGARHNNGATKDIGFPFSLVLRSSVMARSIASMVS